MDHPKLSRNRKTPFRLNEIHNQFDFYASSSSGYKCHLLWQFQVQNVVSRSLGIKMSGWYSNYVTGRDTRIFRNIEFRQSHVYLMVDKEIGPTKDQCPSSAKSFRQKRGVWQGFVVLCFVFTAFNCWKFQGGYYEE